MAVRVRRGPRAFAAGLVAFLVALALPATSWAVVDSPQVLAVHTQSESRVTIFLEADTESGGELSQEELSVTVGGRAVSTTVTPLASSSLSVALVIDSSAGMLPDELEAVQSGATEFLLRLPTGARSTVIAAGGSPRVVAPLSPGPGQALSAVSALRPDGNRSTAAGALLAARELESAPPGPREIVVFSTGADERERSIEQLDEEIARAGAVTYVVQTRHDEFWGQLVERAGGAVLSSDTDQVVASYERLAAELEDQYLVSFRAPVALPAVAAVGVAGGDAASRTVVRLPDPGSAAPESGSSGVGDRWGPLAVLALGLALVVLLALALVRARRRAPDDVAPGAAPSESTQGMFERGDTAPSGAQPPLATLLSGVETTTRAPALRKMKPPTAWGGPTAGITLRGQGDDVVTLRKREPGPAAIRVTGNAQGHFFGVRTRGGNVDVLNTIDPYDGVRALDWEGRESTGFEVSAAGPWTIAVLPIAAVPCFDTSFRGTGDMVLRYTGDGSTAKITGNEQGQYFSVRLLPRGGTPVPLVNTMEEYSASCSLDGGPALFAVQAVGEWTISIS